MNEAVPLDRFKLAGAVSLEVDLHQPGRPVDRLCFDVAGRETSECGPPR
jgi:hypothetical protein